MSAPTVLLTGANGYIGRNILPKLLEQGCNVVCCVRDKSRFWMEQLPERVSLLEVDFLDDPQPGLLPKNIDVAYYLLHSMQTSMRHYDKLEAQSARNFNAYLTETNPRQVIYLTGIVNDDALSKHLASRKQVEDILSSGPAPLTALRAGIVVGAGSASFEIIRDLTEKLPLMVAPRWVRTRSQPTAVHDVIAYMVNCMLDERCYNQAYDIGGPDVLTYRQMLLRYGKVRRLRRGIATVPVMTPRLSSYWLVFVTRTSFKLAASLIDSLKTEVIGRKNPLEEMYDIKPLQYDDAVRAAFGPLEQFEAFENGEAALQEVDKTPHEWVRTPRFGCSRFVSRQTLKTTDEQVRIAIRNMGGKRGYPFANYLWRFRMFIDKLVGGKGYGPDTRGAQLQKGDTFDYWKVLIATDQRLLLQNVRLKVPGDAWMEFTVSDSTLTQTATFRPRGVLGRLYWILFYPAHAFVFVGLARRLARGRLRKAKRQPTFAPDVPASQPD